MRAVAVVGAEGKKFTAKAEQEARAVIRQIIAGADLVVSGGCHLGGVDSWAEEEAEAAGIPTIIHLPAHRSWAAGYKPRNLLIAKDCSEAHCIVVSDYPPGFPERERYGARDGHPFCYHCGASDHVKSGGCWTLKRAEEMGRVVVWHIIENA